MQQVPLYSQEHSTMQEEDPYFLIMLDVKELSLLSWNAIIPELEFTIANMMMTLELNAHVYCIIVCKIKSTLIKIKFL